MLEFLNSLSPAYRKLLIAFGLLFAGAFLVVVIGYAVYPWPSFTWQQLQELQVQELPLYVFERGSLEFTLPAENYILFERWLGNTMQPNLIAFDVYLVVFTLGFVILLGIISALPRYWFYIGTMIVAFLVALCRWDALLLGGSDSTVTGLIIVTAFLGMLFYFQFLRSSTSFLGRTLSFTGLCVVIALVIVTTSAVSLPLRLLAVNTLPAAIAVLIMFIILVSHQIMASFVSLAVASSKTRSLSQYLIISSIYLLNLWLTYLNRIGWMEWDYTIPSFLLFAVSSILTVWTIRQREPVYASILKSDVLLVYFILGLGIMAMAACGFYLSTSNDIILLSLNDLILYIHIGYGMMFLLYVLANFLGVFEKNLPVAKVLYKPTSMPYFSYRFAGLIFSLALIFYNNWLTHVNHFTSGYYTALGDLHFGERGPASFHNYRRAHVYAPYNQHASTALATLEGWSGNYGKEKNYSIDANRFMPTEFTILNTDQMYLLAGKAYEDVQLLRAGKARFPSSGVIRNNLGLAFTRIGVFDSASYYFNEAANDRRTRNTAAMNLLGLLAKSRQSNNPDSTDQQVSSSNPGVRSNAFALANGKGRILDVAIEFPTDSTLNLFSATLITNYLTNHTTVVDTAVLGPCIRLAHRPANLPYKEMILQSVAKACYAAGQVNRAVELLQEVVFSGTNQGSANYALGLMAMDQEKDNVALSYFYYALNAKSGPAALANAVALAEGGRLDEALVAWDTISHRKDTTLRELGESMKRILAAPASWFGDLSEREKLYYALYRIPLSDSMLFNRLITQIKDEDLRARAFLKRAKKYFTMDELALSIKQYQHLQGLHLTDTRLFAEIKYFEARLLAAQRRIDELLAIVKQGILFGPYRETTRVFYQAVQQEAAGDSAAATSYLWLSKNNWYYDEGIVAASAYFKNDVRLSYGILSDALQVNPHSVKILKAFIPVALARGFDQYAVGALETLQGIISKEAFRKYVDENQLSGLLLP